MKRYTVYISRLIVSIYTNADFVFNHIVEGTKDFQLLTRFKVFTIIRLNTFFNILNNIY